MVSPGKRVSSPLKGITKKSPSTYRPILTSDEHRGETDGHEDDDGQMMAAYLEEDELHVEFLEGGGGDGVEEDAYDRLRMSVDSQDDDDAAMDLDIYKRGEGGDKGGSKGGKAAPPPPPPPPPQDTMMRSSPPSSSSDDSHGPSTTTTPKQNTRPQKRTAPANPFELLPANSSAEGSSSGAFDIIEQDDLDDTDDELEDGMFRYSNSYSPNRHGSIHHDAGTDPALDHTPIQLRSVARAIANLDFLAIPGIIREMRVERRRKRVERALAMDLKDAGRGGGKSRPDVSDRRSARMLCLSSWCALSEGRGVAVLVGFTVAFVVVYKVLEDTDNDRFRRILLACGLLVVAFRLLWWPVYWYVWGRRVNRRRQATMELYDGLNGEAAAGCELTSRDQWSYDDEDEAAEEERRSLGLEICAETGQAGVVV